LNSDRLRQAPNIAIVGSTSPLGKELKDMLQASEFPTGKLTLLETEEYAGLLQEFAGEIRITQVIAPSAFEDVDIAFFACSASIMDAYAASGSKFPEVTIDLTGTRSQGTVFLSGLSDPEVLASTGYIVNPNPAATVLARVLSVLDRSFGVSASTAVILEPASQRGTSAVDELQEQTVSLLNFHSVENRVFEGQLAFNILAEPQASHRTEDLVRGQLRSILPAALPLPRMMAAQAPVFHGHGFGLFVDLRTKHSVDAVIEALAKEAGALMVHRDEKDSPSPVSAVGTDKIHIGRVSADPDSPNAYTIWITADNLRVAAATALQTAECLVFPNRGQ
jgi:aspartate-semialdehyde dehydrogenase